MKLEDLPRQLEALRQAALLREPDDVLTRRALERDFGADFLDVASNDYLDLADDRSSRLALPPTAGDRLLGAESRLVRRPEVLDVSRETAALPFGAAASRLVFGSHQEHVLLEQETAAWLGFEAALYFSTGYAANVGALGALLSKDDAVFSDQLNHASLIDGIRLSGARAQVYRHLDLVDLDAKLTAAREARTSENSARWVIAESYYSMDGDGPDLPKLAELCRIHDAQLYIDEAHAVGTFGSQGRGLCAEQGVIPDVLMAAFGKAVGAQGACLLGSKELRVWLWNRARSFVFSTAPGPRVAADVRFQLRRVEAADEARIRLSQRARQLRELLADGGAPTVAGSFGPIVSVVLGEAERALSCANGLRARGILAQAIRPPTVQAGQCRLRLVLRSSMSEEQVRDVAAAVLEATKS